MKNLIRSVLIGLVVASNAQAVVMGNRAGIDEYNSVGSIVTISGGLGSFVTVSSSWALTAAHVVDDSSGGILIGGHPDAPGGEPLFLVSRIIVHPDYVVGEFHDDLALIELAELINPAIHSMDFATFSSVPLPGTLPSSSVVTGYGQLEIGVELTEFHRHYVSAPTTTADPFTMVPGPTIPTVFPTDCAGGAIHCVYGTVGGAPGDSGGGMFAPTAGGEVVTAINSFIFDENDLDPSIPLDWTDGYWTVGTSVAAYEAWIKEPEPGVLTGATFSSAAFVPIPAAVWLFGSSLLGLILVSRRATKFT